LDYCVKAVGQSHSKLAVRRMGPGSRFRLRSSSYGGRVAWPGRRKTGTNSAAFAGTTVKWLFDN
ncbi:hypothetical protein, partial [Bradyrhizobium sp.]|uniref:hypothetical protein n=1 Tax=Bradyrhizobium sp. TaxID=376 RepID=UPI003C561C1C